MLSAKRVHSCNAGAFHGICVQTRLIGRILRTKTRASRYPGMVVERVSFDVAWTNDNLFEARLGFSL
jgi:hypothetical protein